MRISNETGLFSLRWEIPSDMLANLHDVRKMAKTIEKWQKFSQKSMFHEKVGVTQLQNANENHLQPILNFKHDGYQF